MKGFESLRAILNSLSDRRPDKMNTGRLNCSRGRPKEGGNMCSRLSRLVLMVSTATLLIGLAGTYSALAKDDKYMARQHGHEHGYRDGYDRGREDRDRHAKFDLETKDYKEGDR